MHNLTSLLPQIIAYYKNALATETADLCADPFATEFEYEYAAQAPAGSNIAQHNINVFTAMLNAPLNAQQTELLQYAAEIVAPEQFC